MKNSQITVAKIYGLINYEQGIIGVPAQSKDLMAMLKGRKIGVTPKNEASSIDLYKAWMEGWHEARKANEKKF